MSILRDLVERLRALVSRDTLDAELDEELRFHLERETAERAQAGSADPAREAHLALGGVTQVREATRDARGVSAFENTVADLRFAARGLRRSPFFTVTVVGVLGVAIGAATTVFAVTDRVLLAPLPYDEPDRIVRIFQDYSSGFRGTISVVDFQAIEAQQTSFAAVGLLRPTGPTLSGVQTPEVLPAARATSGVFDALAVRPAFGRAFQPGDDAPDAPPVVVVSHALAERLLGGGAAAVGRTLVLDGVGHDVVGVLRPEHEVFGGVRVAAVLPLPRSAPDRRGPFGFRGIARLRDGVSVEAATTDLDAISRRIFPLWQSGFQDSTARLIPVELHESVVGFAKRQLALFAGAVVLVLLLAIANAATLFVVRSSARGPEIAVRAALGATRLRLVRLVVTECALLTALAGAVAMALAVVAVRGVPYVAPNVPWIRDVTLGGSSVVFAIALVAAAGVLVSIAPLVSVMRGASARAVSSAAASGRVGGGRRARLVRSALVVSEFALALPLLAGAGLLLNSVLALRRVDPGFDPRGVYALSITLPSRYQDPVEVATFWRLLLARVGEVPGIVAAGVSTDLPPDNFGNVNNFELLDREVGTGGSQPTAPWPSVDPGYFAAMGVALLEGRGFSAGDTAGAPPVAIVSRSWAARYYPNEPVVGRQLYSGGCRTCEPTTVIAVVGDLHYRGIDDEADAVYVPAAGGLGTSANLVVRSGAGQAATFAALRGVLGGLVPDAAPQEVVMEDQLRNEYSDPTRWAAIVGGFSVMGVVLATLGIFGLMSYVVVQRRRELGVRLAIGAPPASLTALVVQSGLRHAALGVGVGAVVAVAGTRWIEAVLFDVAPTDPLTLAAAGLFLLVSAVVASWVPGRRAARLRPLEAMLAPPS